MIYSEKPINSINFNPNINNINTNSKVDTPINWFSSRGAYVNPTKNLPSNVLAIHGLDIDNIKEAFGNQIKSLPANILAVHGIDINNLGKVQENPIKRLLTNVLAARDVDIAKPNTNTNPNPDFSFNPITNPNAKNFSNGVLDQNPAIDDFVKTWNDIGLTTTTNSEIDFINEINQATIDRILFEYNPVTT